MMQNRQLEDANFGSEQINNISEEGLTGLFALRRKEIEVIVIRTVEQLIGPILEPLIRRVVKEEIESAREKISTSRTRNPGNDIHPSESRSLQLRFSSKISQPVMTGEQIKGEERDSIKVALVDYLTGQVVTTGPLASAKVEMLLLRGDFDDDGQDWTLEEFNGKIVRDLVGKGILLNGKTCLNLKEGVGVLDEISFKHNSNWLKSCELRLGARVVDIPNGIRVREAKTDRFTVMDRRNNLYKKHFPPSLTDEVWRLKNIGRDGPFHKRLIREHINTVEDFLREYSSNPQRLQDILHAGDKMWDIVVGHARTCVLDKTMNVAGQVGILSESQYVPCDGLPDTNKANAQKSVVSAYEQLNDIVSYDGETSVVEGSSCPPIAENPSNLSHLEIAGGYNFNSVGSSSCLSITENPSNSSQLEFPSDFYFDSVEGFSSFPSAENPSNLSLLEIPNGNFNSSLTIGRNDYLQPSTSYGGANDLGDYSFDGFENYQSLSMPVQVTNSLFSVPESSTQASLRQISSNIDLFVNTQNPNLESQGYLQSVVNEAMLKVRAQRKRTKYPKVLLRFISLQVVTLKRIRAAKKLQLC